MPWDKQIDRIVEKIERAKAIDSSYDVFGSSSHKYKNS